MLRTFLRSGCRTPSYSAIARSRHNTISYFLLGMRTVDLLHNPRRCTKYDHIGRNILQYNGSRGNNRISANGNARTYNCIGGDPDAIVYGDGRPLVRPMFHWFLIIQRSAHDLDTKGDPNVVADRDGRVT